MERFCCYSMDAVERLGSRNPTWDGKLNVVLILTGVGQVIACGLLGLQVLLAVLLHSGLAFGSLLADQCTPVTNVTTSGRCVTRYALLVSTVWATPRGMLRTSAHPLASRHPFRYVVSKAAQDSMTCRTGQHDLVSTSTSFGWQRVDVEPDDP
eukprot:365240-Chlamydomonas_euryale.AAC.3